MRERERDRARELRERERYRDTGEGLRDKRETDRDIENDINRVKMQKNSQKRDVKDRR